MRYDEERPSFVYSHVNYDIPIDDHPVASRLPKASTRPSVQASAADFRSVTRRPDGPKELNDYLFSDEPQLSIHISSFEDATLISVTWGHWSLDAMGLAALLNAWTQVLNGQEDHVAPLHGFDTDPLALMGSSAVEESCLASRQIKGLDLVIFALCYVFEFLWWRKQEDHVVCLPASYVQSMKQTTMEELIAENQSDSEPFVSDGDVVCAWWTRLALQHLGPTSNRTVIIINPFDLRGLLAKDLLPASTAYLSNAVYAFFATVPASAILQKPLSFLASQIRRQMLEQGTRNQMEALAALSRKEMLETGRPSIFGDSTSQLIAFSNWTKGKFYEFDFSAAVTRQGLPLEMRANAIGKPSYVHSLGYCAGMFSRYSVPIYGKDAAGNYWLSSPLRASTWRKIEEDFAAME